MNTWSKIDWIHYIRKGREWRKKNTRKKLRNALFKLKGFTKISISIGRTDRMSRVDGRTAIPMDGFMCERTPAIDWKYVTKTYHTHIQREINWRAKTLTLDQLKTQHFDLVTKITVSESSLRFTFILIYV